MSIFYIKTKGGDVFELTATTDVAFSYKNTITKFPVEAGFNVTDHSTVENTTLSMDGVITQVVQLNKQSPKKGIKEYIEGLDKLRRSNQTFTVFLDNKLKPFPNCLFTSLDFSKSTFEGVGAWKVSLAIEQIRTVSKASRSKVKVEATETPNETSEGGIKASEKDKVDGKKDEGNKPTITKTIGRSGLEIGEDGLTKVGSIVKQSLGSLFDTGGGG